MKKKIKGREEKNVYIVGIVFLYLRYAYFFPKLAI